MGNEGKSKVGRKREGKNEKGTGRGREENPPIHISGYAIAIENPSLTKWTLARQTKSSYGMLLLLSNKIEDVNE